MDKRISRKIFVLDIMRGSVKHEGEMRLIQIYLKLNFGLNICMFVM